MKLTDEERGVLVFALHNQLRTWRLLVASGATPGDGGKKDRAAFRRSQKAAKALLERLKKEEAE